MDAKGNSDWGGGQANEGLSIEGHKGKQRFLSGKRTPIGFSLGEKRSPLEKGHWYRPKSTSSRGYKTRSNAERIGGSLKREGFWEQDDSGGDCRSPRKKELSCER